MSAIRLEHLVKRFGAFTALKTMDLAIADGEFMALLGPSGCGKSTTMNMIAGMEEPSEGRILFGGRDMVGVPMGRRGVGFVFQNYAIFTHMSVRRNLDYGLRMTGRPTAEIRRRTEAMADLLGLTALLDRPAAGLSVNILQRLAIGRSAVMEPAIFLLDEPLSNVDAAFRAVMRTELKSLQRQFRQTMVYVTHDQLEAMTMADRVAVMDHGVLQQVGTPLDVYNAPVNTFVARFIGSPGMNLCLGTLVETDRGVAVDLGALGVTPPLPAALASAARSGAREVTYGFRPEEVHLDPVGLRLPLILAERIGARTILHLGRGNETLRAVFQGNPDLPEGDIAFAPDPAAVRLFDTATGAAIRGAA
jgi:multiple sugar transport system ATP-binding protein